MNLADLLATPDAGLAEAVGSPDFAKLLATLCVEPDGVDFAANRKAYNGEHAILDDPTRAPVIVGSGEGAHLKELAKLAVPFQRRIVETAVAFLFGEPVKLSENSDDPEALSWIEGLWKRCKLDYVNRELARDLFVETRVAELWQVPKEADAAARPRVTILSHRTGYSIYPHWDALGDMDAFTVRFETKDADGKTTQRVVIYAADSWLSLSREPSAATWTAQRVKNPLGKIPVVYYEQGMTEWAGVETQIERMEYLTSNFADANDYFGAPYLITFDEVEHLPDMKTVGKHLNVLGTKGPDGKWDFPPPPKFLTWDQAPAAIELEWKMLKDMIFSSTSTPDLSFDNVKGMSAVSGIALRLMFLDAENKARLHQETFGEGLERRVNLMRAILGLVDGSRKAQLDKLDVDIHFDTVVPQDVVETLKALSVARGGEPIMSEKTAVEANPMVDDTQGDLEELAKERGAAAMNSLAQGFEA